MTDPRFELRLDAEVSECGDSLAGAVVLDRDSEPASLSVIARYRVVAADATTPGIDEEAAVHRFDSPVGESIRFLLELPAKGPISYDGRTFGVTWRVDVEVDKTVVASAPVTVLPAGGLAVWAQHVAGPPRIEP